MNDNNSPLNKLITKLGDELQSVEKRVGFFDIETKHLFSDLEPNWDKLNFNTKQNLRAKLIPKMKISISGILTFNKQSNHAVYTYYEENEVNNLIDDLKNLDKIVGHNLNRFDWDVLSPYTSESNIKRFKKRTIDTWDLLKKKTGQWIALNDLGNLNFEVSKTVDTLKIPEMWKTGKHKEVKEYLKTDLDILASIFYYGISQTPIKYYEKSYGKIIGRKSIILKWKSLIE